MGAMPSHIRFMRPGGFDQALPTRLPSIWFFLNWLLIPWMFDVHNHYYNVCYTSYSIGVSWTYLSFTYLLFTQRWFERLDAYVPVRI
jgi:hypothetical protein